MHTGDAPEDTDVVGPSHDPATTTDTETVAQLSAAALGAAPRPMTPGTIVLAATPIGDASDAPARLVAALGEADLVAAEDTRRLRNLADRLGVTARGRVLSYHEHNEVERAPRIIAAAQEGQRVLVVSDAGMPSVSDPGFRLVGAAHAAGVPVTVAPGPSAVLTALALSGLATDRFCFEGFLPRKAGDRARHLASVASEPRTMVFFEAPHRLAHTLGAMAEHFGDERPAAVCRELTKTYEEVRRGPLAELVTWAQQGVRGEITIVVAGAPAQDVPLSEALSQVQALVEDGSRLKDACAQVAERTGRRKKELYDTALAARER